jgi:aminopeptidase N
VVAIRPQDNTELTGLYRSSGNYCTQCEAEGFRRITSSSTGPDVMARYRVTVTADKANALSGAAVEREPGRGRDELADGRHARPGTTRSRSPAYLFALVAGDLRCHAGSS